MGLNPYGMVASDKQLEMWKSILDENFNDGSPYFSMYKCGYYGVPLNDIIEKCQRNGIALRKKDLQNYNNGVFSNGVGTIIQNGMLVNVADIQKGTPIHEMKLCDFPKMPIGWIGTDKRFFPCTQDNKPMQPWGWKKNPDGSVFMPELMTRADATALSPCGWVGQNMLYQKFVVMDIDGHGHGSDDTQVIEFGNLFKQETFSVEDPRKPGSFHLYFETDRLIPVKHFPWAKLDFMGNAVNAAVYFKDKKWNGVPMLQLTEEIWQMMLAYQQDRKRGNNGPQSR